MSLREEDLDKDALQNSIDVVDQSRKEREAAEEEINRQRQAEKLARYAEQQKAIDEGAKAQAKNNEAAEKEQEQLDPDRLNLNNNPAVQALNQATNARNIGYLRGLNGIFTAPERAFDWATGAMAEEKEETGSYSPDWDPFRKQIDDNAPKNWWEAGFQWGAQESTTIAATAGAGIVTGLGRSVLGRLGLAAGESFLSPDIGQENNVSGSVRWLAQNQDQAPKEIQKFYDLVEDTVPWLGDSLKHVAVNNPLATNEGEDVNTMTLKSILENIMFEGTGEVLDFMFASRRADSVDINDQTAAKADEEFQVDSEGLPSNTIDVEAVDVTTSPSGGKPELPQGTFRASKNADMADPGQGKYNSRTQPDVQYARRNKQTDNPDDMGTTGTAWSASEIENWANTSGIPKEYVDGLAKNLYSSAYYKQSLGKRDWAAGNQQAFRRFQKLLGKQVDNMKPEQFWDELFKKLGRTPKNWNVDPVVADLMTADLFSQIRNRGMAALELGEKFDIMDTDGPLQNIAERMLLYDTEVAKAKFATSPEFLALPAAQRKQAMDDFTVDDYAFADEKMQEFFQWIKDSPDDSTAKFAAEMFSKQNVQSMPQLRNFLRSRFRAEKYKGANGERALMRELNALTMLAQLADPGTLIRAVRGTSEIMGLNTVTKMAGYSMIGDFRRARAAAAEFGALREVWGDVLQIFNKNKDLWWNKKLASIGNRYNIGFEADDAAFEAFYKVEMEEGTFGDKFYASTLQNIRALNRWQGFSYPFAALGSVDQMLDVVGANRMARYKAYMEMSQGKKPWESIGDKKAFDEARQNYLNGVYDGNGNVDFDQDPFLQASQQEAKLTKPLTGWLASLDEFVEKHPEMKLFYRYATTAINDIAFDYKNTPLLGAIHKDNVAVYKALQTDDFSATYDIGVTNREEALQHRAITMGRQALGTATLAFFLQAKQDNNLTGNGTLDYKINNMWKSLGWKPMTLTLGPINMDLSEMSGLGGIIALASDVVDNRKFMGDKWADMSLAQIGFAIGASLTTKKAFQPINDLMRFGQGEPGSGKKLLVNMASSIPGAKWFDKLGEVMMPYQAELSKSLYDQMRNRFQGGELFRKEEDRMKPKRDILYDTQLNPWDYVENVINMVTPINMSLRENRPATDMLLNSGYPMSIISNQHDGVNFEDNRNIRDAYNEALAKEKLGPKMENMMKDPKFMASLEKYHQDLDSNTRVSNPVGSYYHLKMLNKLINRAKDNAWLKISRRPDVLELVEKRNEKRLEERRDLYQSQQPSVLNMTNK